MAALAAYACGQTPALSQDVEAVHSDASAFYLDVHQNPELSAHKTQTAVWLHLLQPAWCAGILAEVTVLRTLLREPGEELRMLSVR